MSNQLLNKILLEYFAPPLDLPPDSDASRERFHNLMLDVQTSFEKDKIISLSRVINETDMSNLRSDQIIIINVNELRDKTPRTLLYGYTCNRDTWHVYLDKNEQINLAVYEGSRTGNYISHSTKMKFEAHSLIPNKRVYPAACDLEFCELLKSKGIEIPYTTYQKRETKQFHGYLIEDLIHP